MQYAPNVAAKIEVQAATARSQPTRGIPLHGYGAFSLLLMSVIRHPSPVIRHSKLPHQKRILVRDLVDDLGHGFARAVAGAGLDADEDGLVSGLSGLEGGGELETVGGDDAVVVVAGEDERRRILRARM